MADQVGEQVEDLRRDRNQVFAAPQLAPPGIEHEIFGQIAQLNGLPRDLALADTAYGTAKSMPP